MTMILTDDRWPMTDDRDRDDDHDDDGHDDHEIAVDVVA